MATINFINGKMNKSGEKTTYKTLAGVKRLINYILNPLKTNDLLIGSVLCNVNTAYDEFILTKSMHNKLPVNTVSKSNEVVHFVQSFDVGEIKPEIAKEIADKLANHELFNNFQIVYAVHTDKEHIHTHFVINTVNYEDGYRWHISKHDLQSLKDYSDELCKEYNLSVVNKKNRNENMKSKSYESSGEYRSKKAGRSWKAETLYAGMNAKKVAQCKEEFIEIMNSLGYKVRWEDTRKDITFTNKDGKKINSDKLGYPGKNFTPLTKDALLKQFERNKQAFVNKNETLLFEQERTKSEILKAISKITYEPNNPYPFQDMYHNHASAEGQAMIDKIKELQKGSGLDWER